MICSLPTRLAHALFGLMAIWCLGCTSFDALVDGLTGGTNSVTGSCMTVAGSSQQPDGGRSVSVNAAVNQHADLGCGCTQCVSVEAQVSPLIAPPHPIPETVVSILGRALIVNREPLVPPPQTRATA
jgi:hypothetical protein